YGGTLAVGVLHRLHFGRRDILLRPHLQNGSFSDALWILSQSLGIGLGVFMMTGTAATFAIATTYASYKPKIWKTGRKGIMAWRPVYVWSLFVFPLVACVIQIAFTFRFDLRGRSDDLHCDYSDPTWIRFLSYAGTPWLLTIPCFFFSVTSIRRIHKTNQHIKRSCDPDTEIPSIPRRTASTRNARASLTHPEPSRQTSSPTLNANRGSHGFTVQTTLGLNTRRSSVSSVQDSEECASRISSTFPTFANLSHLGTGPVEPDRITISSVAPPKEDWRDILGPSTHPSGLDDVDKPETLMWNDDGKDVDFEYGKGAVELVTDDDCSELETAPSRARRYTMGRKPRKQIPKLSPAIYRVIYFQW
ncbi:hypothetical protein H0H92_004920, partial [Tricholoma furcatifolium]